MARRITVTTNKRAVLKDVMTSNRRALSLQLRRRIEPQINRKQEELKQQFNKHVVTREIDAGELSSSISGVTGGYGNLFSFIGFSAGSRPTLSIKEILSRKIVFNVRSFSVNGDFKISYKIPSIEEIFASSPIPWAQGLSWAEGIEKGISNINSYVYNKGGFAGSRSGHGLQVKNGVDTKFNTTPYISKILEGFKNNLKNI